MFDASVAVRAFLPVPGNDRAEAAIRSYAMVAPALIVTEVANTIWKYHRRGDMDRGTCLEAIRHFAPYPELRPDISLHTEALEIACEQDHPVYDCLYLALARREGYPLLTADKRLLALARERLDLAAIGLDEVEV
ncbi:hypothetical protein AWH62_11300 [Maricaulis sp. W15]|uniref:type II toxin-antitoxin system VapC family toxin n=1 Tax=Maricaulis TaxID=74317 RepID=UPI00096186F0|nr:MULTISPECIES: type II toxin-antitoxin system VapC family toxin [Maricaulis]OLF72406.1 hypothetical protein AWH62_11300 [Maricaulis sp. W15]